MWTKIKGWLAPPVFEDDEEKTRDAGILNVILLTFLAVLGVAIIVSFVVTVYQGYVLAFVGVLILSTLGSLVLMRRNRVQAASVLFSTMLWAAFIIMSLFTGGVSGPAFNFLILVIFIASVLLGWRVGALLTGLSILTGLGLLYAENNGLLPPSLLLPLPVIDLINRILIFLMVVALANVIGRNIKQALEHARRNERNLAESNRELQVIQKNLTARTRGLETVTAVSEGLAGILDFDQLLVELVNRVKEGFGYYHVHIYILDEARQDLIMAAGVGQAGAQMKAQRHHIALDAPTSLVAQTARSERVVNVPNVRQSPDWLANPLLPDTQSEMAVPIIVEGQVAGVLDVQQNKTGGFDATDANLLRSLANQVAVAIRNARLFDEVETALTNARIAQERYVSQSWQATRSDAPDRERLYIQPGMAELSEATFDAAKEQALAHQQPAIVPIDEYEGSPKPLVAPVLLGGQTIGTLQLHKLDSEDTRQLWTEQDLEFVETILDQVAQTAENLRLFEETRQRASREATIREITDKLRAAPNLKDLVQTASEELGSYLSATHIKLKLGLEAPTNDSASTVSKISPTERNNNDKETSTNGIS